MLDYRIDTFLEVCRFMNFTKAARALNITQPAVSQHIRILKEAGLLSGERRGYHMHYAINRERLRALARDIEAMADAAVSGGKSALTGRQTIRRTDKTK